MARFGQEGVPITTIPKLSQETLAEMVGTTRSRVSFFMNRFRKLGFINYDVGDNLNVHSTLLNVLLLDDDKTGVTADDADPTRASIDPAPPARPGGLPDKDRAKKPPLFKLNHSEGNPDS